LLQRAKAASSRKAGNRKWILSRLLLKQERQWLLVVRIAVQEREEEDKKAHLLLPLLPYIRRMIGDVMSKIRYRSHVYETESLLEAPLLRSGQIQGAHKVLEPFVFVIFT
jgi:hypothetical protein